MAKILIVSHSPTSTTGYGRVVRCLAGSLMTAGHSIVCLGAGSTLPPTSLVFSKFAQEVVQKATGRTPVLIYHGVDTKTFCPGDRTKAKQLANVAGHFVVGMVARNQMRKNIPALVKAFAKFSADKDDALLYLHTQLNGEFAVGELVRRFGIENKTRMTGEVTIAKGVSDTLLATVYRALDVFVLPTMAEGFGLPIMESQACGTPALVTDFSACPELVPDPIQRLKVKETLIMARNLEQAIVDIDDIAEKLNIFYHHRERLSSLGELCHQFAQSFEWNNAYQQFNELFASERFQEISAKRQQNRELSKK